MEQDPDSPYTFWLQSLQTTTRHRKPPIDPVVLIILIPIIALIFLFFFLPQFLSYTSHILKPASVKSTWDSLNIFLVVFAILCGVLARRNDDVSSSNENGFVVESNSSNNNNSIDNSSGQWIGFSDQRVVSGGLRRSSSSYPDLKQDSLWENDDIRNRFYDDFSTVSTYYNNLSQPIAAEAEFSGDNFRRSLRNEQDLVEVSDVKEIVVDTFEISQNDPATPPPPPPPPPPLLSAKSKRHSFRSVGRKIESDEFEKVKNHPPPPPPPPPPALSSMEVRVNRSGHKHTKLERKVSDATKEIATAISSLYNQKKRKHKRKLRNISSSSDSSPPSLHFGSPETEDLEQSATRPPSPRPSLPPPPSMFQNLFKKEGKHKRIHSVSPVVSLTVPPPSPPPPPSSILNNILKSGNKSKWFLSTSTPPSPPPPPSSITNNLFKIGKKSKRFNSSPPPPPPAMTPPPRYIIPVKSKQLAKRKTQIQPQTPPESEPHNRRSNSKGKPPLPAKTSYYERDEYLPSGLQSPLIPMPPPPPPFRMSAMKFELRGDFVRIRSTHSSVCSSPDRDDVDLTTKVMDGGDSIGPGWGSGSGPLFFPSPDVDAKADRFISRLKDEWRMEKINHVKRVNGLKPIN